MAAPADAPPGKPVQRRSPGCPSPPPLGSAWTIIPILVGAVIALVADRRWRHLIVYASAMLITVPLVGGLANMVARPRPDGIEILGDWTGYAQPSSAVAVLTVSTMGAAYALLPAGLELKTIDVDSAGSRLLFDIDRYDEPVWIRFTTMCGIDPMELEPPDAAGVARFAGRAESGRVAAGSTFPGGCLVFEFGEDPLIDTPEARALLEAMHLISRDGLRDLSGWALPGGGSE